MSHSPDHPPACPQCGAALPAGATDGLCPRCLLGEAMQPSQSLAGDGQADAATIPVAAPRPSQPAAPQVELPLPEELTALLPHGMYKVESFLGQGGMGAVYKGQQVRLKRPVAIKIMRRDFGKDYDFEARFEREAQAMAKLNHPNIVSVIDYGEAGADYLYIVMELIDGADLMDVIRTGRMTQEMALMLLPQICDALQFAHDHGIVHRDIKPSNIMLTRDGRIKMADFGLAKRFDTESSFRTQTGTGMGTPDYAAPEQFDAHAAIDHRADIYALGVMIYQMITGQLPRGVWKRPSERAAVAPQWDSIVSRAMQSDPSDRYQQASEVKTDVSSIPLHPRSTDIPVRDQTPPPQRGAAQNTDKNVRATPQSRAPLVFGLVVAAAAIAIGVFFALRQPHQSGPLTPVSGTSAFNATESAQGTVRTTLPASAPAATSNPPSLISTPTAPALPESGWKPLFTDAERAKSGDDRIELKDGLLHLRGAGWRKPQPSADGAIRVRVPIRAGTKLPGLAMRMNGSKASYSLVLASNAQDVLIKYYETRETWTDLKHASLPKPLQPGDVLTLELRIVGNRITGLANGQVVGEVQNDKLKAAGEWGIDAADAWFESVEVQPLPVPAAITNAPSQISNPTATALPESGWKPLFTKQEWEKNWDCGETVYRGTKVRSIREFRDGVLHLKGTGMAIPQTSPDGAIRATLVVREGSNLGSIKMRGSDGEGSYRLNTMPGLKRMALVFFGPPGKPEVPLGSYDLPTLPKTGDRIRLELRVQGNRLTAFINGIAAITASDDRLKASGDWGIDASDAWFESVEVQSLPAVPAPAPIAARPLPESGWKPLFTDKEWKAENQWSSVKDGKTVRVGRHIVDGLLHVQYAPFWNAQPSPDAAIRARIAIREGTNTVAVEARRSNNGGYYKWGTTADPKLLLLNYFPSETSSSSTVLGKYELPASLQAGDKLLLELRAQGNRLTALVNGTAVINVEDQKLKAAGEWGIQANDGWFESVEVQSLPTAAEPWQDVLRDPAKLRAGTGVRRTADGILLSPSTSAAIQQASRDGAIRARASYDPKKPFQVNARYNPEGIYLLQAYDTKTIRLASWDPAAGVGATIATFSPPQALREGQDYELELRIVGQTLTAKLNGQILGTATDAKWTTGDFRVTRAWKTGEPTDPVLVKSLEFLNLDKPAVSASPTLPVSKSSSSPVLTFGGHRYQLVESSLTWSEAKAKATAMGGHLATFTTEAEERWAKENLLKPLTPQENAAQTAPESLYWIGAEAAAQAREFRWLSGETVGKIGWRNGNPGWRERSDIAETKAVGTLFAAGLVATHPRPNGEWISVQQQAIQRTGFIVEWDDAVSSSPTLPISKSSDPKFPPGQWVKLFTKPEDLPADLRKPDSGVKWEDGWIRRPKDMNTILRPAPELTGNYAIRSRFRRDMGATFNGTLTMRQKVQTDFYLVGFSKTGVFTCQRRNGDSYTILKQDSATGTKTGEEYTMEFAVVGSQLIARLDGVTLWTIRDTAFEKGSSTISGSEDIRDIEVINLDGLPEAEALRLLGVDEQGNDLRGKTGAAR